jgi:hypothetical protein
MSDMAVLVGSICSKLHDWASEDAWDKRFEPSTANSLILKEALDLCFQGKYDLMFLTVFKGIEAEAKRLLGSSYEREKPDKIVSGLQKFGLVSEAEFHFLNGLRAVRNEVGHGRPEEPQTEERLFVQNEIKVGGILAVLMLMRLQSKAGK